MHNSNVYHDCSYRIAILGLRRQDINRCHEFANSVRVNPYSDGLFVILGIWYFVIGVKINDSNLQLKSVHSHLKSFGIII